jgi:hypothetical protein
MNTILPFSLIFRLKNCLNCPLQRSDCNIMSRMGDERFRRQNFHNFKVKCIKGEIDETD